jgi:hypothetical protein
MPTADASQFTTIKRYQANINGSLGTNPLKFRAPSLYGGYRPNYRIEYLPPNAIISNKEIVAPPTGGALPEDPPPLQGTIDDVSYQYPPFSDAELRVVSPPRKLISYKLLLNTRIMDMILVMANSTDRITNIKFTWTGGSQTFTDPSPSLYQTYDGINNFYFVNDLYDIPFSNTVMDITTENNIQGIGLRIM